MWKLKKNLMFLSVTRVYDRKSGMHLKYFIQTPWKMLPSKKIAKYALPMRPYLYNELDQAYLRYKHIL